MWARRAPIPPGSWDCPPRPSDAGVAPVRACPLDSPPMRPPVPPVVATMMMLWLATALVTGPAAYAAAPSPADAASPSPAPAVGASPSAASGASPAPASTAVLVTSDEPGTPLHIEGRVVDDATLTPVAGAHVLVYHTDDGGEYEPTDPTDESTARLRAELVTDADGGFGFATILPGEYPGQPPGNRHIHVHAVTAAGYETRGFVLLFDDNVRDEVRRWARDTGFGMVIALDETPDGLRGSVEIGLRPTPVTDPSPAVD